MNINSQNELDFVDPSFLISYYFFYLGVNIFLIIIVEFFLSTMDGSGLIGIRDPRDQEDTLRQLDAAFRKNFKGELPALMPKLM